MKKRATNLLIAISVIMVASLVSMHFWLHFTVLPLTSYIEQRFLYVETLFIGCLLIIIITLLIKKLPLGSRAKKTQMELFITNELFSKTLMSISDGMISTDAAGDITFMNRTAELLTGRSLTESKGKAIEFACDIAGYFPANLYQVFHLLSY